MKGLLADINVRGQVEYLFELMKAPPWADFSSDLDLALLHFDDVGLRSESSDLEIWRCCQAEGLVFLTNNRNDDSDDSFESAIRNLGTADSLPIFTIASLDRLVQSRAYADRVIEKLLEYLYRIDTVRGAGRLFLP